MDLDPRQLDDLDELTEEHLGFSALSDGLGFSSQKRRLAVPSSSDATPKSPSVAEEFVASQKSGTEAPVLPQKNPKPYQKSFQPNQGAGASLAGPVRFHVPQGHIKLAAQAAKPAPEASPAVSAMLEPAAPRSLRALAFAADLAVLTLPLAAALLVLFPISELLQILHSNNRGLITLYAAYLTSYFLLSESFGGQSPGKMILSLHIVEDDKYQKPIGFRLALARLPLFFLSAATLGLGLLFSFADGKRRSWHDKISGTIVRRRR